jgi:diguanylate cyclase (GGDEF)-like protein
VASVVTLVVSTIGITVAVSQISAGLSLESFLFGLAVMPYVLVTRERPLVRFALSAFVLGAYILCEFAFPEGSGDAELPADLARSVSNFDKVGAGVLLFVVVAALEFRHSRLQRTLEGAARYGELRATTDELTGVYNRRPVIAQLSEWSQRGRGNYAIALIDLDHFKTINDEFGHDCGDKILQAVANTLRNHFRDSDMVSRWGGDEFLVLIPGVRHADLVPILERLRRSINLIEKRCSDHVHTVTVSIGAAMGALGQTPDECIAAADHALYRAKEEGRDKVVAVGISQATHALGRPAPDDYEKWSTAQDSLL